MPVAHCGHSRFHVYVVTPAVWLPHSHRQPTHKPIATCNQHDHSHHLKTPPQCTKGLINLTCEADEGQARRRAIHRSDVAAEAGDHIGFLSAQAAQGLAVLAIRRRHGVHGPQRLHGSQRTQPTHKHEELQVSSSSPWPYPSCSRHGARSSSFRCCCFSSRLTSILSPLYSMLLSTPAFSHHHSSSTFILCFPTASHVYHHIARERASVGRNDQS